jgi:GntR family transcriptional repressor for pyruvate dehydrogenase complex
MTSDSTFRVPKAAELIVETLREQVIRGQLKATESLPSEAELCEQFGVSRPTIREAMRILESESLIRVSRGTRGGARIIAPSERNVARYVGRYLQYAQVPIVDIHRANMAIEIPAVVGLASHHTAEDLEVLDAVLAAERTQGGENGFEAILAGKAFHRAVVELAGNRTLAIVYGMLEEVSVAASREIVNVMQSRFADEALRFYQVHEAIVRLVREHDTVQAEKLWRRHLEAKARYLTAIASRSPEPVGVDRSS